MNKRKSSAALLAPPPQPASRRIRTTTFDELIQHDFQSSLVMWLVVEVLSFLILPFVLGGPSPATLHKLVAPSIVLGVGGAWLIGSMSRFIAITYEQRSVSNLRFILSSLAQVVSWIAVGAILYPFIMVMSEFFLRFAR